MRQKPYLLRPYHILAHRYIVEDYLGHGGQAHVYAAYDTWRQRHVALKETNVDAGKQEASILSTLDHPAIPRCIDLLFDSSQTSCVLVLEYVTGTTLLDYAQQRILSVLDILKIGIKLSHIVLYLHQHHRLIHRDIKDTNILITPTGNIKLIDFGIACDWNGPSQQPMGTPGYCAPEVFLGQAGPASDVFAIGAVLYHLLTGAFPQIDRDSLDSRHQYIVTYQWQWGPLGHLLMKTLQTRASYRPTILALSQALITIYHDECQGRPQYGRSWLEATYIPQKLHAWLRTASRV